MTLRLVVSRCDDPHSGSATPDEGLTPAECRMLAAGVQRLPGGWFTRERRDRGRTIVFLLPRDQRDETVPLFLVWRTRGLLNLYKGQSAVATDLGRLADVATVIACVDAEVRRHFALDP